MRRFALSCLFIFAFPVMAAATDESPTAAIADDYLVRYAAAFPESGTSNDLPGTDHGALSDNTPEAIARWRAYEDHVLARLRAVRLGADSPMSDRVLHGVLLDELERSAGVRVCRLELWGVASYVNGWQASLTDLARIQPVGSVASRESALRRARAIPRFLDNEIALLQQGLREGYSSPRVIVREVITQLDGLLATAPGQSPFSAPAQRDPDPAFQSAYVAVVRDQINPAIRRYRDFLQRTYLPAAREALGVSANPNGRACYDAVVRQFSTVAMPAVEVYETGWRELRRLDEELRPLAQRLTGSDDVTGAMRTITTDRRFMFRSSEEVIARAQAAQDRALEAMPRAFGLYTRVPVKIEPYPEFRAKAGAPGQYMPPPEDGSRPPIHLVNTWDPTHKSRSGVESTTFHETWPGHHQQGMVARAAEGQHLLVRVFWNSGFGEGWALYAERVADELGLYSGDLERFGYLTSSKFRAVRMVLDAGIHTRDMGYDEALALLGRHTDLSPEQVRGEVNRYISWPGQAPAYMIGNLEILRLREQARAALGEGFDIRAFHDQVLGRGTLTLPLLRAMVEEWIGGAAAAADNAPAAAPQRAVLVTGASTGIGRKITERLAEAGYFVYAGARKDSDLRELDAIENVDSIRLDVTKPEEIAAAVETVRKAGRGLHGLVNNAGVAVRGPLTEAKEEDMRFVFDVNVFGPYRVTKAFAPLILESGGRITTISSISGILSRADLGVYSMSKHAIEAFGDALAAELEPGGVKVSLVEPGNYRSEISRNALLRMGLDPEVAQADRSQYKEPDEVAAAVMHALFDASPKRRYMVVPEQREAEITIGTAIQELVQLNAGQPYSYNREQLIEMLDAALGQAK